MGTNRRNFLKSLCAGGAAAGLRLPMAHAEDYSGKVLAVIQADGGWDPTSFCDPKPNVPGEPVINHWAENDEVRQAGNIHYAPFADNERFFEKHWDRMLVINGVDAQTNSHSVGVVHNFSGRNAEGYPSLTALMAGHSAPALPAAYLTFGGFSYPAGIVRPTRLGGAGLIQNIANPADAYHNGSRFLSESDWSALEQHVSATAARLAANPNLLEADRRRLEAYRAAHRAEGLGAFADALASADFANGLRRHAQQAILAFRTGVAVSADLWMGGFDTHNDHDDQSAPRLSELTNGVDYLWDFAEEQGVADRLVVVIGSDFGRTNYYNASDGKDHWPIGSAIVMEKSQTWTNRAVGATNPLHFAQRVNPSTLEPDHREGSIIHPKHVHKALRRYLGIEESAGSLRYPLNNTEDFAFFG
ncbi:MAG: DUF1501 domain-containing protein [Gammaproteobacteria bacterium]|nr:DUF1501 domain-containing protein [Gammaproteobacteria bacterium]